MRAGGLLLVAIVLGAVAPARADGEISAGPFIAARGGVGVPWGDIARDDAAVRRYASRKATFGLELGYRLHPRIWGELYFDLGPASTPRGLCQAGAKCTASDTRFGLAFLVRLAPRARLDPWIGLGAGLEVLNARGTDATGRPVAWNWTGVEGPVLEVGLDVRVHDLVTVGPWLSGTAARFTSGATRPDGGETESARLGRWAAHGWLAGGAKATLKL